MLFSLLFPFILGGAIAFILNVPMHKIEGLFEKKWNPKKRLYKAKRVIAFLLTLFLVFFVSTVALFIVIPEFAKTTTLLVKQVPVIAQNIAVWAKELSQKWPQLNNVFSTLEFDWDALGKEAISFLQSGVSGVFTSTASVVGGIVSGITTFFIAATFSIYVLFQKEALSRQCKKLLYANLSVPAADKIVYIGRLSSKTFSNFLSGQCTESVILGVMFFVAMSIFRLPYALLVGVMIAVLSLIPIFGAFIGLALGAFLLVMVNPMQALGFVILFFVLQQIEGNVIYPYVVGGTVGLPSIWVLAAVTIGGNLMGVAGMLIFIPLCSVLYHLLSEVTSKKLNIRRIQADKWLS